MGTKTVFFTGLHLEPRAVPHAYVLSEHRPAGSASGWRRTAGASPLPTPSAWTCAHSGCDSIKERRLCSHKDLLQGEKLSTWNTGNEVQIHIQSLRTVNSLELLGPWPAEASLASFWVFLQSRAGDPAEGWHAIG